MLKINHSHHFTLPHLSLSTPKMALSKVPADDDELAKAIDNDPIDHDNSWELTDRPDTSELESFWNQVEQEIKDDPDWTDFAQE